ncbi:unnamed protein product [Orchesella dallaii]|uniref:Cilia- and flagella-associated protein 43 n=1 Tax=Orchesella dallaii TaxID=48710 RepID=A0ABP1R8T6_9HEXA
MDSSAPPHHGGPLGDVWFRGLPKPDHFLTALKEDFYIMVVGCMMKYIRLERDEGGLNYRARIVRAFNHGVDGIAAICGNPHRDVYAMAEKRLRPRIFLFQIYKSDRGELEPNYMHSLKRIHSWDIRSMSFISKELLVVLTGIPTFNVVLFRWSTNEELMTSFPSEPTLFSRLLISPMNPCHWIEYGEEYMFVYEMPSLSRTDVIRTKINLPKRAMQYEHADPLMGKHFAIKIVSACWTNTDEFFILDEHYGIHKYIPELKVLQWTCSLTKTFLGCTMNQIVPFSDGLAAISKEGWFINYGPIKAGGTLEALSAYKLSSNVVRYIHFPESPESFFAITESKGVVEGVTHGLLRDAFSVPDLMYSNIKACCFIEPHADYMAIVTSFGKVVVLESSSGEPIAKWKLPFKVVGIACHPVLPFIFCGTTYGCINVLDIRNLKTPKLINRRFVTREPNCSIEKFGFVSQGRYVISADVTNSRVFVQYGYPFMAFDFIDSVKVPARISHISVPGSGKDDNRFQVYMSGKSESDEGVVAFVINFNLRNDRVMVIASQIVDQPVTAMCMSPMKKHLYAFYPIKKGLGVVPFCDDNQWLNLQEPEHYVECRFKHDVSFMTAQGNRLYTFGEDGYIQVHEAPIIPKKKNQLPMVLNTIAVAQTHCFSERGIKEGIVSLDGSQVIAIGQDGTFARVRFFPKPKEPDWQTLGYERSKLIDYQVGTYLIDQEFYKSGEEFVDRITDIKIKIEQVDPVNFFGPGEESDEEDDATPNSETPKAETNGEKFKYGPRKSFKGTITRKKVHKDKSMAAGKDTSTTSSSQTKRHVKIHEIMEQHVTAENETKLEEGAVSGGETTRADDISLGHTTQEQVTGDKSVEDPNKPQKTEAPSISAAEGEATKTGDTKTTTDEGPSPSEKSDKASVSPNADEGNATSSQRSSESKKSSGDGEKKDTSDEKKEQSSDSQKSEKSEIPQEQGADKEVKTEEEISAIEGGLDVSQDAPQEPLLPDPEGPPIPPPPTELETQVLMQPVAMKDAKSAPDVEVLLAPQPLPPATESSPKQSASEAEKPATAVVSVLQKLMSKVHETPQIGDKNKPPETPQSPKRETPKPPSPSPPPTSAKPLPKSAVKTATAAPTSSALKGILSERTRRKQMAKDKNVKPEKPAAAKVVEVTQDDAVDLPPEVIEEAEEELEEEAVGKEGDDAGGKLKKGFKGMGEMKKAAKVLGLLFGKKKEKKAPEKSKRASKKKIKKFQGGQASKALAASQASTSGKLKAPPPSRTARNRMGQAKMVKMLMDDADVMDPLSKLKKKKGFDPLKSKGKVTVLTPTPPATDHYKRTRGKGRKEEDLSEASKALLMEGEAAKNLEISVLQDPAIYLMPEKEAKPYEGLDVEDVLTVEHKIRRKEFTEAEFFAQFEKTLMYRQHVPKAHALRSELENFTEMMDDLMMFNKQREEGNQVEMKEFNFDEDREPRLQERAQKMKKIANIQMTVRNKLRHAKINAMKRLVWEQFDAKGVTIMGFRKKLEVSNYPLLPEKEYHHGPVAESISWRRIERRLNLEEIIALREANLHALRVLHHEMQFVPAVRKRLYMKCVPFT